MTYILKKYRHHTKNRMTYEKHGLTITITRDEEPDDPRAWDNCTIMACDHPRYNLGDRKHGLSKNVESWREELDEMKAVYLPLYLYDHGGITMKTSPFSCSWDSGQVGYIYMTPERMKSEGLTEALAIERMKEDVETYDQYLTGDVYCYSITDADGETLDACTGFFGLEVAEREAEQQAAYYAEKARKEKQEKTKALIRNRVPLAKR